MIGSNVSTVGGITNAFTQATAWGCESIQIYTTLSRTWAVRKRTEEEIGSFKAAWRASNVKCVVSHVPFLVNLATGAGELYRRSVQRLGQELASAAELGIDRIVLHPGSCSKSSVLTAIDRIANGLEEAFAQLPNQRTKVLLETMAGQGSQVGRTLEELAMIMERVSWVERMGICCDTCHLYASGYDVRGRSGFESVMQELDRIVGITRIGAFHVNDSKYPLGSKRDRHTSLGSGYLGLEVFQALVQDPRFALVPKIVENPNRDDASLKDIQTLRQLAQHEEGESDG